jgi:hypothetical protein
VGFLIGRCTVSDQILCCVIPGEVPPLNGMDLKILHSPARLATPTVSLQNFTAELAISFRVKLWTWPLGARSSQSVTWTFSRSCIVCCDMVILTRLNARRSPRDRSSLTRLSSRDGRANLAITRCFSFSMSFGTRGENVVTRSGPVGMAGRSLVIFRT